MPHGIRLAVSGAGGGVGQSMLKALAETDYEAIALDGELLGTGLYAAKTSYVIPYASSPNFVDKILEVCQRENVKIYFPGLDVELPVLARVVDRFAAINTQVMVSSPEVIALSDDKLLTYQTLMANDILVPETHDLSHISETAIPLDYPFVLKERRGGARSKNLHVVRSKEQLDGLVAHGFDWRGYIAQEYIEGDEYTCGSINFDGECMGVIVMRRILREGDTYKCFSVKDDYIDATVRKVMITIKPFGACNLQLRVKDGKSYVLEINARSSGTTGARALCGFNEPKLIADYLTTGKRPEYHIKEQTILRYWKELVVDNQLVEAMARNLTLTQNNPTRL
jgi:carbamoyl-phosphate synthase large subunit